MVKVVNYLFDSMFQGKRKISLQEKVFVVLTTAVIVTSSVLLLI